MFRYGIQVGLHVEVLGRLCKQICSVQGTRYATRYVRATALLVIGELHGATRVRLATRSHSGLSAPQVHSLGYPTR